MELLPFSQLSAAKFTVFSPVAPLDVVANLAASVAYFPMHLGFLG